MPLFWHLARLALTSPVLRIYYFIYLSQSSIYDRFRVLHSFFFPLRALCSLHDLNSSSHVVILKVSFFSCTTLLLTTLSCYFLLCSCFFSFLRPFNSLSVVISRAALSRLVLIFFLSRVCFLRHFFFDICFFLRISSCNLLPCSFFPSFRRPGVRTV